MSVGRVLFYSADLTLPPSINRTYHTNRGGQFYMDSKAKAWVSTALADMLLQDWRPVRNLTEYVIYVEYTFFCSEQRDLDNGVKLLLDTAIEECLGLNDRYVHRLFGQKVIEPETKKRKVQLTVRVYPKNALKASTEAA